MKKTLIIAGLAASVMLTSSIANAACPIKAADTQITQQASTQKDFKGQKPPKKMERPNLDERLKLTEEQKTKAHQIRMKGHEQIKPVFEKIKAKKAEIRKIAEDTKLSKDKKEQKINAIEVEILKLKQEARKLRMQNTKEFEAILTEEQKAEFAKIKEEGRKMHEQRKHQRPSQNKMQKAPQK